MEVGRVRWRQLRLRLAPRIPWLRLTVAIATVVVVARIGQQAGRSQGFLWADDYAHLLQSWAVFSNPRDLLDVWGRPLMTITYLPAALLGDTTARVTSLLLLATAAVLCWRTASNAGGRSPALATLFLVAQPSTAMMGYSALPGILFSAVLALAMWLRSRGQTAFGALAAGLLPLARVEGIVVMLAWAVLLVVTRRWRLLPLLGVGLVAWAAARAVVYQDPLSLLKGNPYGIVGSPYGTAGLRYVLTGWPLAFGPIVGGVAIVGLAFAWRKDVLPAALVVIMALFYVAAWTVPLFRSVGTPLYLVSISVPVALVSHGAVDRLLAVPLRTTLRHRLVHGGVAVLVVVVAVVSVGLTQELPLEGEALQARHLVDVVHAQGIHVVWTTSPAFAWYTRADGIPVYNAPPTAIRKVRSGGAVVWDAQFGEPEATYTEAGFVELWSEGSDPKARVVLMRRE
jgi:hypothetical protein